MKTLLHLSHRALLHKSAACFLVFCMLFVLPAQVTFASPSNPQVIRGAAGVTQSGNTTQVDVLSKRAVINWDSLNTKQAETLQFLHDGGHFAVLNRVMKGGATQFNGSLFGNQGSIVIVNPNGIVFGPTALVKAYSFTASSLDIDNTDFMNGVYQYAGDGVGAVANYGEISAEHVALIGKKVLNAGTISSPGGYTIMASGDSVYLGTEGSDVVVEAAGVTVPDGAATDGIGDVINEGTINASDGKIILAAGDTYVRAIEGLDTLSVGVASGVGSVGQYGTLTANGTDGDGGSITLTAADEVVLGDGSVTTANAGANGDGGEIVAYSPDSALFSEHATVQATGGSESGNGGFFEVSGLEHVAVEGQVDLSAANGDAGSFLIDPYNIVITSAATQNGSITDGEWTPSDSPSYLDIDDLEGYLNGQNVIISTGNAGIQSGYVLFNAGRDLYDGTDHVNGSGNSLTVNAANSILFGSGIHFNGDGNVTLHAGSNVTVGYGGSNAGIELSGGDLMVDAGNTISVNGNGIDLHGGFLELLANRSAFDNKDININSNVTAGSMRIEAGDPTLITDFRSNLNVADGVSLTATSGGIDASAREHIYLGGDVTAQGDISLVADSDNLGRGNLQTTNVDAGGNIFMTGRDVTVDGDVAAGGDLTIQGMRDWGLEGGGHVTIAGQLESTDGSIDLSIRESLTDDTLDPAGLITLGGNTIAEVDVVLHNAAAFNAETDQFVRAATGSIIAKDTLTKTSSTGSLYLLAGEHVSLADDVTNTVGGVSIIAKNGRIFTPGGADDTLNIAIVGTSHGALGIDADLPDGDGKAAIILRSGQDLNIGADASLTANGTYNNDAEDRAGIGFLDEDANIGGFDRDKGIPSDIAIYAGSQSGNVNIQTANISVNNEGDGPATVVFDAYDTVTMPTIGEIQQARINQENDNLFWFRLEVASRVTEWLFQAIDGAKLPYAAESDGQIEEVLGHEYVLRGAGLDNVNITDGRAWVLENPADNPDAPVPPLAAVYIPEVKGCPVEMDAAASELAMNTDQLQLLIGNSMAYNPNLQPCEACQKLVTSANILSDADGRRLAAMNEIFNTLAPADAPFTPEIQANITTAFATLSDEDPQYALAQEYVNAFADYVAVIGTELQVPVGDPVTFALEKHGEGITTNENSNVAAYIMAQATGANL